MTIHPCARQTPELAPNDSPANRLSRSRFALLSLVSLFLLLAPAVGAANGDPAPEAAEPLAAALAGEEASGDVVPPRIDQPVRPETPPTLWRDPVHRYRGLDGLPLPFQSEKEILDFLEHGNIVARKVMTTGITRPTKLTLEMDGALAYAVFRSVDRQIPRPDEQSRPNRHIFRDSYIFEVAAYRLSQLLGLDTVPPTVLRTIDGRLGSVQLWVEESLPGGFLAINGLMGGAAGQHRQRAAMNVFDALIYNFDRHKFNYLVDDANRLWWIDHTRSFKRLAEVPGLKKLNLVPDAMFERLRNVDRSQIAGELRDVLGAVEIDALDRRRQILLRHFDKLIRKRGEERVVLQELAAEKVAEGAIS